MREIVSTDPDYYWGWQQLANWYDEEEATADYLESAEQLVRLAPTDPSAFGYRGEARAAAGDRRGAKADFRKAFELDPAYAFAGISLFDGLLVDGEWDEAERTLARLEEHVGGPHVQLRGLRLKCLRKDRDGARQVFQALIKQGDVPPFVVTKAATAMVEAGYAVDVDTAVNEAIGGNVVPPVARLFVERAVGRGDWSFLDKLPELLKGGAGGREVLYAAVDTLAAPAQRSRLHEVLAQFGDEIRQTHRGWAKAAGALTSVRDYAAAATWAADWEARKPDEPWMLHPVAFALRQLGRAADAQRVTTYALGLAVEDAATTDFRVWAAFEEALDGRADRAEGLLDGVDEDDLDDVPRVIYAFTRSLITVQTRGAPAFVEAREQGRIAIREFAPKEVDPDLRLSYQRWAKRLARAAGGIGPWVWATFHGRRVPGG
jgi:tetratricopeptide (TPR) repeat protein